VELRKEEEIQLATCPDRIALYLLTGSETSSLVVAEIGSLGHACIAEILLSNKICVGHLQARQKNQELPDRFPSVLIYSLGCLQLAKHERPAFQAFFDFSSKIVLLFGPKFHSKGAQLTCCSVLMHAKRHIDVWHGRRLQQVPGQACKIEEYIFGAPEDSSENRDFCAESWAWCVFLTVTASL
jgi:hypothetical protein